MRFRVKSTELEVIIGLSRAWFRDLIHLLCSHAIYCLDMHKKKLKFLSMKFCTHSCLLSLDVLPWSLDSSMYFSMVETSEIGLF